MLRDKTMKSLIHSLQAFTTGTCAASALWFPTLSLANNIGAGDTADVPLFASFSVESNIFFMLDDSGSMFWEMTSRLGSPGATNEGRFRIEASSSSNARNYVYAFPNADTNSGRSVVPPQKAIDALKISDITDATTNLIDDIQDTHAGNWRSRNYDFNRTYYNPNRTYEPWAGRNINNIFYNDADPENALVDPFQPALGTYDLTTTINHTFRIPREDSHDDDSCQRNSDFNCNVDLDFFPATYWAWNPANANDTTVDPNEYGKRYEIVPGTSAAPATYPRAVTRLDCDGTPGVCTYNEEIQNFANWFQYHSRREFAMKAAVAEVISRATGVRMGLSTLHRHADNGTVEREISSMTPDASADNPDQNKDSLLRGLFRIHSRNGTPLRSALHSVGDYFTCDGSTAGSAIFGADTPCPIDTSLPNPAGECQQNFAILFSDGFWNRDSGFDIGNHDGPGDGNTDFDGPPFADTHSNTLADVAMKFYEGDLSSLADNVPTTCGVDENNKQHLVTYTIGFGVTGTIPINEIPEQPALGLANQCTADTTLPTLNFNSGAWPQPVQNTATAVDDMIHAAYNGRGEFFSAQNSDELAASLINTIQSISDRSGSGTAVSFNASVVNTDTAVYLAEFNTDRWSGNLSAFGVDQDGNIDISSIWNAAEQLNNTPWANRNIWTHNGSAAGDIAGVAFEWDKLSTVQQNDLRTNSSGLPDNETTGQARLNYIHGERVNEQNHPSNNGTFAFRERDSRLGDIIQSSPVFVGAPSLPWLDQAPFPDAPGQRYSEFRESLSDVVRDPDTNQVIDITSTRRTKEVVYVGANDGMLHAFDASNGNEVFAYIPSYLYSQPASENAPHPANSGLHYLTDRSYNHRYYHDMTPTISDVYINGEWRTVLVGGHRAGAEGLFALDITDDPGKDLAFSVHNPVLWEFRGEEGTIDGHKLGDNDLGLSFSKPQIVLTNAKNAAGQNRWGVVFGNGYNQSGNDAAQLFILFLDAKPTNGWVENTHYIKISTEENGGTNFTNGLSSPASVDLDGNGTVDRVYAGDLAGNMWSFDLCVATDGECAATNTGQNLWKVAHGSTTPEPLYRGVSTPVTNVTTQHVTTQPQIIRNPIVQSTADNAPNLLVLFGTGRYISNGDGSINTQQSFYGVWDAGTSEITATQLVPQTLTNRTLNDVSIRTSTDNPVQYSEPGDTTTAGDDLGWRVDFPTPAVGERNISNALVRDGIVFFSTIIPSDEPCDAGGNGFVMFLDVENGGQPDNIILDINNDGEFDQDDLFGTQPATGAEFNGGLPSSPAFLANKLYITGTNTTRANRSNVSSPNSALGRVSWGEILGPLGNPNSTASPDPDPDP